MYSILWVMNTRVLPPKPQISTPTAYSAVHTCTELLVGTSILVSCCACSLQASFLQAKVKIMSNDEDRGSPEEEKVEEEEDEKEVTEDLSNR